MQAVMLVMKYSHAVIESRNKSLTNNKRQRSLNFEHCGTPEI